MELTASTSIITRDYHGMAFQFRTDGFFNMTRAAKHFGKDLSNFMRSPDTIEYLDELSNSVKSTELIESKMGRHHGGTWGHSKLAVFFARWLDVKFSVWCDAVIDDLLRGKADVTITKPAESAVMALPADYSAALRALADSVEKQAAIERKNLQLECKVAEQAPKVQFHDDVGSAINCQTVDEVAKELGTGRTRLFQWLRGQGYLMGNNLPYQRYIDLGLFKTIAKTRKDKHSGESISYNQTLITGKGLTHIHKRIKGLPVELPANDHHAEVSA